MSLFFKILRFYPINTNPKIPPKRQIIRIGANTVKVLSKYKGSFLFVSLLMI